MTLPRGLATAALATLGALAPAAGAAAEDRPPVVRWERPAPLAAVGGTLHGDACRVRARDDRPGLRVEFHAGRTRLGVERRAPYTCRWDTRRHTGRVVLRAVAIDRAGHRRTARRTVRLRPTARPGPAPPVTRFPAGPGATAPVVAVLDGPNIASSVFAAANQHLFAIDHGTLELLRLDRDTLAPTGRAEVGGWPAAVAVDPRTGDVVLVDANDPDPRMVVRRVDAAGRTNARWVAPAGDDLTSLTVAGDGTVYVRFTRMREDAPDELTTHELVRVLGPDLTSRAVWDEPAAAEHQAGAPDGTLWAVGCPSAGGCRARVVTPAGATLRSFGLGSTEVVSAVAGDAWGSLWVQADGETWPGSELRRYHPNGTLVARYTAFDGAPRQLHRLAVSPDGARVYVAYPPDPAVRDRLVLTRLVASSAAEELSR